MFYTTTFIIFCALFGTWSTDNMLNIGIKLTFLGMSFWSAVEVLKQHGYIINV